MFCRTLFKASSFVCKSSLFAVLILAMSACNDEFSLKELDYNQEETRADQDMGVWDGTTDISWYNDTDTEFQISTAEQLAGLAKLVNEGNGFSGKTVKLTANILLNNTEGWENWNESNTPANYWTPIGISYTQSFTGTLDGDGHSVSGIYINNEAGYHGLVGHLGKGGTIQNLGVKSSYIYGDIYI